MNKPTFDPAQLAYHLDRLYVLWNEFSMIELFGDGCISSSFEHFNAGTAKSVVEQWFESVNKRFKVADALAGKRPVTLKTRVYHLPAYDRNGVQVCVGDAINAQVCAGRFGQTAKVNAVIKNEYEPHGQVMTTLNSRPHGIYFDPYVCNGFDIGYHEHNDFDHGHVTWIEVVQP